MSVLCNRGSYVGSIAIPIVLLGSVCVYIIIPNEGTDVGSLTMFHGWSSRPTYRRCFEGTNVPLSVLEIRN